MKTLFPLKISKSVFILILVLLLGVISGFIAAWEKDGFDWRTIVGNLSSELIGAVVLYFILEKVIHQNEEIVQKKTDLINQMDSSNNSSALDAIKLLNKEGWLQDGSLKGRFFNGAQLQTVNLTKANLSNVGFYRCNLTDAKIDESQLCRLNDLRFTIMPNEAKYDGRFRLNGDLEWARIKYNIDFLNAPNEKMAEYYGVSLAEYIKGQEWADQNLDKLETK
jgi:uncharacterized membrane protein YeaQ/YmgE (transglycosylase-associated protein family)